MASINKLDYFGNEVELDPMEHASSENTYGLGNASLYGHVKLSDNLDDTSDVDSGTAATPKAVNTLNSDLSTHKSTGATNEVSGHVKLSDSTSDSTNGVGNSFAATPKAVNTINASLETHVSTYADASNYGHVKISDSPNSASDAANHWSASPKALYNHTVEYANASAYGHVKVTDSYAAAQSTSTAANHWATSPSALYGHAVTYGSGSQFGHVKLSDSANDSTNNTANSIAATPKAVNTAKSEASAYGANLANATSILGVAHGGTGVSTLSSGNVLTGNAAGAVKAEYSITANSAGDTKTLPTLAKVTKMLSDHTGKAAGTTSGHIKCYVSGNTLYLQGAAT